MVQPLLLRSSSTALHDVSAIGAQTLTVVSSTLRTFLSVCDVALPHTTTLLRKQRPPSSVELPFFWKEMRTHSAELHSVRDLQGSHSAREAYFTPEHFFVERMHALPLQTLKPSSHSTHFFALRSHTVRLGMCWHWSWAEQPSHL